MEEAPKLSPLQYLILTTIEVSEKTGMEIREDLKEFKWNKSSPTFYQLEFNKLMDRLEKEGYIDINHRDEEGNKSYKIKTEGLFQIEMSRNFYKRPFLDF